MTFLKFDPMRHFDDIASKFETALNQACDALMEKGFAKAEDIKKRIPLRKLQLFALRTAISPMFFYTFSLFLNALGLLL